MEEEEANVRWTAELEVALFHSMHGHKPVGKTEFAPPHHVTVSHYISLLTGSD